MPKIAITWHTAADERVCEICGPLEGYTWESDSFPPVLVDSQGREVWNCNADVSTAHSGTSINCRCTLTWVINSELNINEMKAKVSEIVAKLDATLTEMRTQEMEAKAKK